MKFLSRLAMTRRLVLDGREWYLVHATPRDPLDEYLGNDPVAWKQRLTRVQADFVCVGHSHVPFQLDLGDCRVINPGSVGQPRDGDPRASYALVEDGVPEIRRVPYDIDAVVRQMKSTGVDRWIVELTEAVLRSGGQITREEMDRIT
jgi:diadenosine tetraphosphatase ApaH/serine/threonine PP2A family protein phosphatase